MKRLFIREEARKQNKRLFSTAKKAGVQNFGKFNNMGYLGLYGMSLPKIKRKKALAKTMFWTEQGQPSLQQTFLGSPKLTTKS